MALSPYRWPMDAERLALQTARIGGFAFVFLALVFTYNYIETTATNYIVEATRVANVAAVVCADDCKDRRSKTPNAQFTYQEIAPGVFNILMDVPRATSIEVFAFETATGEYHRLGEAIAMGEDRWKFTWNTEAYDTGDYWIKALVQNRHGMYDRSDSEFLSVE